MAMVKVTHPKITSDETKTPPKREPVPPGVYVALIMAAPLGVTKGSPPLNKLSVEFQILHADDEGKTDGMAGRRVFQDYILEHDPKLPDLSAQRAYELRMLLEAAGVPFTDEGFDPDLLLSDRAVKITVRHRSGKVDPADPKAPIPVFTNVTKVDTAEEINEADLV